jgi:hypothetical protein
VTSAAQQIRDVMIDVVVEQKAHYALAADRRADARSSRVRSGNASRMRSSGSPRAKYASTAATGTHRRPRDTRTTAATDRLPSTFSRLSLTAGQRPRPRPDVRDTANVEDPRISRGLASRRPGRDQGPTACLTNRSRARSI